MCPFSNPTGIAVIDERAVKQRIQHPIYGMMHESVTNGCFVDDAMFRIEDMESMIGTMAVSPRDQFLMERKDVVFQVPLKLLHVLPSPLPAPEFTPGGEEIV